MLLYMGVFYGENTLIFEPIFVEINLFSSNTIGCYVIPYLCKSIIYSVYYYRLSHWPSIDKT